VPHLSQTVFTQLEFWLLITFSFVVPAWVYGILLLKRAIARTTVSLLGLSLVGMAGVDVYLLQAIKRMVPSTASLSDDAVFASELSVAFYLLPAMLGGIGTNLLSHVLIEHLHAAEKRYQREHP
jgi:hypothetical protein